MIRDQGQTAPRIPAPVRRETPPIASLPAASSSHSSAGLSTPPGNRQLIPTIATGSRLPLSQLAQLLTCLMQVGSGPPKVVKNSVLIH